MMDYYSQWTAVILASIISLALERGLIGIWFDIVPLLKRIGKTVVASYIAVWVTTLVGTYCPIESWVHVLIVCGVFFWILNTEKARNVLWRIRALIPHVY